MVFCSYLLLQKLWVSKISFIQWHLSLPYFEIHFSHEVSDIVTAHVSVYFKNPIPMNLMKSSTTKRLLIGKVSPLFNSVVDLSGWYRFSIILEHRIPDNLTTTTFDSLPHDLIDVWGDRLRLYHGSCVILIIIHFWQFILRIIVVDDRR